MRFYINSNPPFERAVTHISAITNANPAEITTTTDHNYESGDIVRLIIPEAFGMVQVSKLQGTITVTGTDTFTIDINTKNFDTFAVPSPVPWYVNSTAQVIPVGEVSANLDGATKNIL